MDNNGWTFSEWMEALFSNPGNCGAKGICFYLAAAPAFIICGVLGLAIFPPGRYPKIVLILPGLILGLVVAYIYGFITYKLPVLLSVPISLLLSVIGGYYVYIFGWGLIRAFISAI